MDPIKLSLQNANRPRGNKNYDINFIQTFNPIDLIGLNDTLEFREVDESKSAKFALSACYQNSKTLFNSREIS